jgi:hypothetical protein
MEPFMAPFIEMLFMQFFLEMLWCDEHPQRNEVVEQFYKIIFQKSSRKIWTWTSTMDKGYIALHCTVPTLPRSIFSVPFKVTKAKHKTDYVTSVITVSQPRGSFFFSMMWIFPLYS